MARSIIIAGLAITALGLALLVVERAQIPLGRLPGDLLWRGKNTTVYFPLATSLLVSAVLSLLLWAFGRR